MWIYSILFEMFFIFNLNVNVFLLWIIFIICFFGFEMMVFKWFVIWVVKDWGNFRFDLVLLWWISFLISENWVRCLRILFMLLVLSFWFLVIGRLGKLLMIFWMWVFLMMYFVLLLLRRMLNVMGFLWVLLVGIFFSDCFLSVLVYWYWYGRLLGIFMVNFWSVIFVWGIVNYLVWVV